MTDAQVQGMEEYSQVNLESPQCYDVVIVGGGPAGLSAAGVLGRCLRKVLVCDHGKPRHYHARASMHSFLSREGEDPNKFLKMARDELKRYHTVELRPSHVEQVVMRSTTRRKSWHIPHTGPDTGHDQTPLLSQPPRCPEQRCFQVVCSDGTSFVCRAVLLASGTEDILPEINGLEDFYCKTVHCNSLMSGWEHQGRRLVAYGNSDRGIALALQLTRWSKHVILCTNGPKQITAKSKEALERLNIAVLEDRIKKVEGDREQGLVEKIIFANGKVLECDAIFISTGEFRRCPIVAHVAKQGEVRNTDRLEQITELTTTIDGIYVAGSCSGNPEMCLAINAASDGARAALAIHRDLMKRELGVEQL